DQLRARLDSAVSMDVVMVDMSQATGVDTSGYGLIQQSVELAVDAGAQFVFAGVEPSLQAALDLDSNANVHWFADPDDAFEYIEQIQLERTETSDADASRGLDLNDAVRALFTVVTAPAGNVLMRQGELGDELLIIEHGHLSAMRTDAHGTRYRLRSFGTGSLVGEIGMLTGGPRTADVVAETDVRVLKLTRQEYEVAKRDRPDLAFQLDEFIMVSQAERVRSLSDSLDRALA
ncbi:MAG: cyclic nucleotide-binding domain-containing protein, partial [Acidimicrobiales bacterium]|nr:cyclic nucleotide-binding domain-containing protein [Acidimicrobiales bacterium]